MIRPNMVYVPIIITVKDHSDQVLGSPSFRPLLKKFKHISSFIIVTEEMHRVDDQDQRLSAFLSAFEGNLLQFVEGTFHVKDGTSFAWATDREEGSNVVLMLCGSQLNVYIMGGIMGSDIFKIESLSEPTAENLRVCVGLEHGAAMCFNLFHGTTSICISYVQLHMRVRQ